MSKEKTYDRWDVLIFKDGQISAVKNSLEYDRQKLLREKNQEFLWIKNLGQRDANQLQAIIWGTKCEFVTQEEYIGNWRDLVEYYTEVSPNISISFEHFCMMEEKNGRLNKAVYDSQGFGPWIKLLDDGIRIGSIVEGSQAECTPFELSYPFTVNELKAEMKNLEEEHDRLWKEANESCIHCYEMLPIDFDYLDGTCPNCGGEN